VKQSKECLDCLAEANERKVDVELEAQSGLNLLLHELDLVKWADLQVFPIVLQQGLLTSRYIFVDNLRVR